MTYEIVPAERAYGELVGVIFGSQVRVLARSPIDVVFSCGGIYHVDHRDDRKSDAHNYRILVDSTKRVDVDLILAAKAKLDDIFGAGAGQVIADAFKARATVLFEGGGSKLRETRAVLRDRFEKERAARGCDWKADLTGRIATCLQCGKNLKPDTDIISLGQPPQKDGPRTVADCQKMTNHEIVELCDFDHVEWLGYVKYFTTWDGVSTTRKNFCCDKCAIVYAHRAADELPRLAVGIDPVKEEQRRRDEFEARKKSFVPPNPGELNL